MISVDYGPQLSNHTSGDWINIRCHSCGHTHVVIRKEYTPPSDSYFDRDDVGFWWYNCGPSLDALLNYDQPVIFAGRVRPNGVTSDVHVVHDPPGELTTPMAYPRPPPTCCL